MDTLEDALWSDVEDHIDNTILVAWDGCHKIYLALDQQEAKWFREGYPYIVQDEPEAMLASVMAWYESSCSLKFVSGVRSNPDDPNAGFVHLIEQFDERNPEFHEEDE